MPDHVVRTSTERHEYDRDRALRVYEALRLEIINGRTWTGGSDGYEPRKDDSDDDRIVALFELLDGSQFGDWVFGSVDFDHGVELATSPDDA